MPDVSESPKAKTLMIRRGPQFPFRLEWSTTGKANTCFHNNFTMDPSRRVNRNGAMFNGDAMAGVFGVPRQYNQQKRASLDGLAARQAAVAAAFAAAQKDKSDPIERKQRPRPVPEAPPSSMFPEISSRANPVNPPYPPTSYAQYSQQPQPQPQQRQPQVSTFEVR